MCHLSTDTMIGEKLGRYTLLETIGTGCMGTVYRAEDSADGRVVALKLIRSQVLYDRERRERFLQGILAASETRHKSFCPILEIGDDNDDFFVVMPFLESRTLDRYMDHKPLAWPHAVDMAIEIAGALSAAHAVGAVHRGLKPTNVWVQDNGSILISDCSVARFTEIAKNAGSRMRLSRVDFADTLIPLGALAYMSPEQIRGDAVDARTDIFSLGALLYEMLTGHHPFESRNSLSRMSAILEGNPIPASARVSSVPPELDNLIEKALSKFPAGRYQSMGELAAALVAVRQSAPAHFVDAGLEPAAILLTRQNVLITALALILLLVTLYWYLR